MDRDVLLHQMEGRFREEYTKALVLCLSSIFGLLLPAPPGPRARVRALRASGGTGPRAGARGSDAAPDP